MTKPQITIRLSPTLLNSLNQYVEETGTSKTDVVVSAIAQYLGCAESMPLSQRMAEVERRVAALEAEVRSKQEVSV
jgi:hypothetical protein